MLSTVLVYLSTELECFLQGGNAFYSVGIPLYRAGMLYRGVQCFLEGWNTFLQSWNFNPVQRNSNTVESIPTL
jgi:ABC-type glycerol-3-phosphate transport system permease component